jgi:hypothetical protein
MKHFNDYDELDKYSDDFDFYSVVVFFKNLPFEQSVSYTVKVEFKSGDFQKHCLKLTTGPDFTAKLGIMSNEVPALAVRKDSRTQKETLTFDISVWIHLDVISPE